MTRDAIRSPAFWERYDQFRSPRTSIGITNYSFQRCRLSNPSGDVDTRSMLTSYEVALPYTFIDNNRDYLDLISLTAGDIRSFRWERDLESFPVGTELKLLDRAIAAALPSVGEVLKCAKAYANGMFQDKLV